MALANRLVGNKSAVPALEAALTGVSLMFDVDTHIGIAGATASCMLNRTAIRQHQTIRVRRGDRLDVGPATNGVRSYVAFAGGLQVDEMLGSASTYLPAGLGGHEGRALVEGDTLQLKSGNGEPEILETPEEFRLPMLDSWTLRACQSGETSAVKDSCTLFETKMTVAGRNDRMGIKLDGRRFETTGGGQMPSAPVFPGIIQCPKDGSLFILSVDAGTTGGYPRVAKIIRADLHLLGQLRQGNQLSLIERDAVTASIELKEKQRYWQLWLADVADIM